MVLGSLETMHAGDDLDEIALRKVVVALKKMHNALHINTLHLP